MLMRAKRRFPLTPHRKVVADETFEASDALAARLVRRGDAEVVTRPSRKRQTTVGPKARKRPSRKKVPATTGDA